MHVHVRLTWVPRPVGAQTAVSAVQSLPTQTPSQRQNGLLCPTRTLPS